MRKIPMTRRELMAEVVVPSRIEVLHHIDGDIAFQLHVRDTITSQHYVISYSRILAGMGHPETLVFPADENGTMTSGREVAGGAEMTIDEALVDLIERLSPSIPPEVRQHIYHPDVSYAISGVVEKIRLTVSVRGGPVLRTHLHTFPEAKYIRRHGSADDYEDYIRGVTTQLANIGITVLPPPPGVEMGSKWHG
jgi:hypothetical protein